MPTTLPTPLRQCFVTFLFLFLAIQPGYGQETRGTIVGEVTDENGALLPGALVSATNLATNVTVTAPTNEEGKYAIPYLLSGIYRVSAEAKGFKVVVRDRVELRIADRLQLDFSLPVGATAEVVEVRAETPLLQTASSNIGQTFDAKRIQDLPLPHGSPYSLMYLAPGVNNVYPGGFYYQTPTELNATSTMTAIQGAPLGSTDFTVDGIPNTQTSNANYGVGISNSPPADVVQEFKVETAFDASVGRTSGTVVNVVLKSGQNDFHGAAYIFHRQPQWNANSFFANKNGDPKGDFHYDRWGGSLTGPVRLPKLYDGRNRSFFSYGYEGMRNELVSAITTTVPDPAFRNGDFSALLKLGPQYQIYDPATIRPVGNGRFIADPFPNNIIPPDRINPIAKKILSFYPEPNVPGTVDKRNNYSSQTRPEPVTYYNHVFRFDQVISDKQRLYVRTSISRKDDGPYRNYWDNVTSGNIFIGRTRQFAIDDVYTFSPTLALNVRYGYLRYAGGHKPRRVGFDVESLGFSPAVAALLTSTAKMFPRIDISGLESLAFEGYDVLNNDGHTFFASFTKQARDHNLKFGADIRVYRDNVAFYGQASGRFTFGTNWTRGPFDNSPSSPGGVGQGLAAFLLGLPTGGFIDRNDNEAIQSTYWSLYLHDNWRISKKLTLDLGIRWEYEGPTTERYDRSVRGFDFNAVQPIEAQALARYAANPDPALPVSQFHLRGGLLFAGRNGQPREFYDRDFNNFAPRIGLAYQVRPNVVWRAGFGMYYISIGQPAQNRSIQSGFNQRTDIVPTLDNGQTFIATLSNPFPNGVLTAPGAAQGIKTFLGRDIFFYDTSGTAPYTMRWNTNVQTLLPAQVLLEIGYTGSKSIGLQIDRSLDALPNQYLSRSSTRDQATINFLTANVPNPMAGLLPGTSLNGSTIPRWRLLVPYPQFNSVTIRTFQGYTWYNAFQLRAERRLSQGFTAQFGYTFSKQLDATAYQNPADPVPTKAISAFDRTHQIGMSAIYELPFGKGRRFFNVNSRWADALIGGWQLNAIWLVTSGEPLSFGNVIFNGNFADIPLPSGSRSVERWFNTGAGFNRNSAEQLAFNIQTFPIRLANVRAGTYNSWDLSLLKDFRFTERQRAQFRLEVFNAFNYQRAFAPPDTNPTSSSFGQVFSSYSVPRTIQLGFKYLF
jgi:hypothetical protein